MKKKGLLVGTVITVLLTLTACGNDEKTWKEEPRAVAEVEESTTEEVFEEEPQTITKIEEVSEEETQEIQETEEPSEEPETAPAEIVQEEYHYVTLLRDMIRYPKAYWEVWEDRNKPEDNQFAIVDINSDGVKELLVRHDDHGVSNGDEFKSIDIYQYQDVIDTFSYAEPEFYRDGTILQKFSGNFGESGWDVHKNTDYVSAFRILDKSKPAYYFDDDFPIDKDTDGDGIVYAWYDYRNGYTTEGQYMTEQEYNAKLAETVSGTEKLDIKWHNLTEENMFHVINPVLTSEDRKLFDSIPVVRAYLFEQCCLLGYKTVDETDIDEFFDYYFARAKLGGIEGEWEFEDFFKSILPSAQFITDEEDSAIYQFRIDELVHFYKEAFQREITMDEIISESQKEFPSYHVDLEGGYIECSFFLIEGSTAFEAVPLKIERQDNTLMITGIGFMGFDNDPCEYTYKFRCTLQKNENSPLHGYTVTDSAVEKVMEIDMGTRIG